VAKRLNTFGISASGIPIPVSFTEKYNQVAQAFTTVEIAKCASQFSGVYLYALLIRLLNTNMSFA
jgi:hypothetical protein